MLFGCCSPIYTGSNTITPAAVDPNLHTLTISVYLDQDFNAEERFAIEGALENWNQALNGYLVYQVKADRVPLSQEVMEQIAIEQLSLVFVASDNPDPENQTIAYTSAIGGNVITVLRNRWQHTNRVQVMMHEIGHSLSAEHNGHPHSLMAPGYVNGGACVDQWTMREVIEAHQWMRIEHVNFCVVH